MGQWWTAILVSVGVLALLRLLVEFKSSRGDGKLAKVHPYRRMMPIIMPSKVESLVFFDQWLPIAELERYLKTHGEEIGCRMTHIIVAAVARGFHHHPNMNRFVSGGRLYDRDDVWVSFSMKRKKLDASAKVAVVKMQVPDGMSLKGLCDKINGQVQEQRTEKKTYLDKELNLFLSLPTFILKAAFRLLQWCDDRNILPQGFTRTDAMFTSAFVANLGTLGMSAGYHHLYEWGNCPLFIMIGQTEERVLPDGKGGVKIEEGMQIRFTYDERVEDGLTARHGMDAMMHALTEPETAFGKDGEISLSKS